jgi:hypothetical protein
MDPLAQLRLNGVQRRAHTLRCGPSAYNKITLAVGRAVVREPKKRKHLWLPLAALLPIFRFSGDHK